MFEIIRNFETRCNLKLILFEFCATSWLLEIVHVCLRSAVFIEKLN